MKLNQIIAMSKTRKGESQSAITQAYHKLQKADLFNGLSRSYTPKDDDGTRYPDESKKVVTTVVDELQSFKEPWTNAMDVVITQDFNNNNAVANIEVDGNIISRDVPAVTLIFLEKQLNDILNVVEKIPTLDPNESWHKDTSSGLFVSDPIETIKTKKVEKPIVLYHHTPEHPAQTQLSVSDEVVGIWTQKKLSGAMSPQQQQALRKKVLKLKEAVVKAREQANSVEVEQKTVGEDIYTYIFE